MSKLSPGWTGGQYSILRAILGGYLFLQLAGFLPLVSELAAVELVLFAAGLVSSALLLLGRYDRAAAAVLLLALVWSSAAGGGAGLTWRITSRDGWLLVAVGWLLAAHLLVPPAPYLSLSARGRADPGGGWRMPSRLYQASWVLLCLGHAYIGYSRLIDARSYATSVPELLFPPLALFGRTRPWIWAALLLPHLGIVLLTELRESSLGMVLLHLFTFDARWLAPRPAEGTDTLYYDGRCGLCQRWIRFLLAEEPEGRFFRFAPLGSSVFLRRVPAEARDVLPDSLVLVTTEGILLTRSSAVLRVLNRLGGLWRLLAIMFAVVPRPLADGLYDRVAVVRYRLFRRPPEACPLMTPELRRRFDDVEIVEQAGETP